MTSHKFVLFYPPPPLSCLMHLSHTITKTPPPICVTSLMNGPKMPSRLPKNLLLISLNVDRGLSRRELLTEIVLQSIVFENLFKKNFKEGHDEKRTFSDVDGCR